MSLKERVWRILVVSGGHDLCDAVRSMLPVSPDSPICTAQSIAQARRSLLERPFDLVLIDSPLPDGVGTGFAVETGDRHCCAVLLLVRRESYAEVYDRTAEHGVFLLPKPVSRPVVRLALDWMCTARQRLQLFEQRTVTIEEKMAEIRLVDRAKWLLIEHRGMTEPDAHRYIEKQAMDRCLPRRAIAESILQAYT